MELLDALYNIVMPLVILWLGMQERARNVLLKKLDEKASREELDRAIEQSKELYNVQVRELKGDVKRLEIKIDELLNLLLRQSKRD